jgi:hypothetical protein
MYSLHGRHQAHANGCAPPVALRRRATAGPAARARAPRSRPARAGRGDARDLALAELQTELQRRCGVRAGLSTIHNALRRLGPHGHWRTTTFVAGIRQSGVIAPLVLDGPMTGPAFRAEHRHELFEQGKVLSAATGRVG